MWSAYLPSLIVSQLNREVDKSVLGLLSQGSGVDVEKFFVIAWTTWKWRNLLVFEEKLVQPNVTLDIAFSL